MDQLVAEDGSMEGVQTPVASSREKKVCGTCGSEFTSQSNLTRHVETNHTDQNTPEAMAKRLKLQEYRKNHRRERHANDPVYREKIQKINQAYKMKVKARIKTRAAGGGDADASINELSTDAKASSASINEPPTDAPEPPTDAPESDNRQGGGSHVKKAHKKDKPKGVPGRVETMALTTANVASFFAPKYGAPRSKEQRAETPRPSAI
jgi:uncharacterized C2H2 Zn-finger protein